jgi:hypothetical protein
MIFFNVTFPPEIINFINFLFVQLIKEEIESNQNNVCPCQRNGCLLEWYEIGKFKNANCCGLNIDASHPRNCDINIKSNWNIRHCNVLKKDGIICHNIFDYDDPEVKINDDGFICEGRLCNIKWKGFINNICCIKCLYPYSTCNECIECARIRFNNC